MKPLPPPSPWPPLTANRGSRWIAIRDIVLTLAAWVLLGYLLRDVLAIAFDFFSVPRFQLTMEVPPDLQQLWQKLGAFVIVSGILVAALTIWTVIDRRRLLTLDPAPQPVPLTTREHTTAAGLGEKAVHDARTFRITRVLFGVQGAIEGFEPVSLPIGTPEGQSASQHDVRIEA